MDFISKLCHHYNLTYDEFKELIKEKTIDDIPDYTHFKDIDKVTDRIHLAIKNNEKILIYGDYDCDGIMATSILVKTFELLNYDVGYYIPSRYLDGYGLNCQKVQEAYNKGYKLIITVDNGVMQHEAVNLANNLGIDVIITDHHNIPDVLPDALYILHPTYSNYGDLICCGAYVAFMLSWSLLGHYEPYLLSLAAIATISDLMELKGYNRNIVKISLAMLNEHNYPSIFNLIGAYEPMIDESTFALRIAPKINAVGRVLEEHQANKIVHFLTTNSMYEIRSIGKFIDEVNNKRKEMTSTCTSSLQIDENQSAIVIICEEKEGLIGLIANQLLQKYNKPVIVFSKAMDEEVYKGSARSKNGFSIVKAFESLKDLLVVYGGHSLAGGCSIKISDFDKFKERFISLADTYKIEEEKEETIELQLDEVTLHNYQILSSLGPFGMGFKAPKFSLPRLKTSFLTYSNDGKHIMTPLSMKSKLVGFYIGKDSVSSYSWINIEGKMALNYFRGNKSLQFIIDKYTLE